MTLVEVMVATAVSALVFGVTIWCLMQAMSLGKWQSVYETACSYGEQALEYALYVPYTDFARSAPTVTAPNYVSNGLLYTTATSTNLIQTTQNGLPYTLTNITYLATQNLLPLDDLGSYLVSRTVTVTDRSQIEPAMTNLNYTLITVSNTWQFRGQTQLPIVYRVIRDSPNG